MHCVLCHCRIAHNKLRLNYYLFLIVSLSGQEFPIKVELNFFKNYPPTISTTTPLFSNLLRERSQMTSSKIWRFSDPLPHPSSSVIFTTSPSPPFFPRWFSAKLFFMVKFKITKSGFSYEHYSKQKSIHLLLAECFRYKLERNESVWFENNLIQCVSLVQQFSYPSVIQLQYKQIKTDTTQWSRY